MRLTPLLAVLFGALLTAVSGFALPPDGYKPAHIMSVNLGSVLPPAPDSEQEAEEHEREEHQAKDSTTLYIVFRSPADKRMFVAEMPCGADCSDLRRELETHRDIEFKREGRDFLMKVNGKTLKARQHEQKREKDKS